LSRRRRQACSLRRLQTKSGKAPASSTWNARGGQIIKIHDEFGLSACYLSKLSSQHECVELLRNDILCGNKEMGVVSRFSVGKGETDPPLKSMKVLSLSARNLFIRRVGGRVNRLTKSGLALAVSTCYTRKSSSPSPSARNLSIRRAGGRGKSSTRRTVYRQLLTSSPEEITTKVKKESEIRHLLVLQLQLQLQTFVLLQLQLWLTSRPRLHSRRGGANNSRSKCRKRRL
jgi:hypothetical protein